MLEEDGLQINRWKVFRRRTAQTRKNCEPADPFGKPPSGWHYRTGLKTAARYERSTTVDDVVVLPTNPMN